MEEPKKITVVKKYGAATGKEMYKVRGDENGWCSTPQEAVERHHRCNDFWAKYYAQGSKK